MATNTTRQLKAELWRRFGTAEHPAEWDGLVYGGGKLSQRYWEYFRAIELLELDGDSVIVDIGGGSPTTGLGFFAALLATVAKEVIVMDPQVKQDAPQPSGTCYVREDATFRSLSRLLTERSDITHIACISVFEHIEPAIRAGIIRAIDDHFQGSMFVTTFEFHAKTNHFQHQLTAASTSQLFQNFTRFFPDRFDASPVLCENAYDPRRTVAVGADTLGRGETPRWYPVAARFCPLD